MMIFWGLFFLTVFLLGLYLMVINPIAKKYQSTHFLDLGLGSGLMAVALIYVTLAHIMPQFEDESVTQPCGKKSPQAICYGLDTVTCSRAWHSFDETCELEIKPIREKRPTTLLYPITYKCHAQKFDKITFYNRRRTDTAFCREYFKKIE